MCAFLYVYGIDKTFTYHLTQILWNNFLGSPCSTIPFQQISKKHLYFPARRRNAAKRKKLKSLGKSKSTDTEEEEAEEDCGDDGKCIFIVTYFFLHIQQLSV